MKVMMTTSITLSGARTTTTTANGGVFYIANLISLDFRQPISTTIATYTDMQVLSPAVGSFIYSKSLNTAFYLENLDVSC